MIICFRNGRLGNQIFQYAAIKSYAKVNEKIILIGFGELYRAFETENTIFILKSNFFDFFYYPKIKKFNLDRILKLLSNYFFSNIRIFKILYENDSNHLFEISNKFYLFKNIKFVKSFYGQSEKFINDHKIKSFQIKKKLISKSKRIINNLSFKDLIYFIHIRRGDYTTVQHGLKLKVPIKWYQLRIKELEKKYPNISFIVCSDDGEISKKLGIKKNIFYSNQDYLMDFVIMSECDGGILSPSSFSWWSAWFSNKNSNSKNKNYIAPNYWMGFDKKKMVS